MTGPLDGVTVVVTRPAAQAGPFIERARAAGARCIAFPSLVIERLTLAPDVLERVREGRWDWAIHTSTNAVESILAQAGATFARRHAAVGKATARALERHGLEVSARPETANSEGLLSLPEFARPAGLRVLIVKGRGGRDLLREALATRGAEVLALETYERRIATPDDAARAELDAAAHAAARPVIAATSIEVLEALLEVSGPSTAASLREATLLVPGQRVAQAAERLGWRGPRVVAATAEDDAMLEALRAFAAGNL